MLEKLSCLVHFLFGWWLSQLNYTEPPRSEPAPLCYVPEPGSPTSTSNIPTGWTVSGSPDRSQVITNRKPAGRWTSGVPP
jgi:hypothetical protein